MTPTDPPAVATWLVKHLSRRNDALVGDLLEEYRRGRSVAWYWKQALTVIVVSRSMAFLLTAAVLAVYSIGRHIPIPGANAGALAFLSSRMQLTSFQFYDLFVGGNLGAVTMFGLGIMPYVSASLLMQLLALLWRSLTRRTASLTPRHMLQYTRLLAILLCVVQAYGIALFLERQTMVVGGLPLVYNPGWVFRFTTVTIMTCGTAGLIWLSDYMTERGIGNGMFLTFVAGLVVGLPGAVSTISRLPRAELFGLPLILTFTLFVVAHVGIVAMTAHFYRRAIEPVH